MCQKNLIKTDLRWTYCSWLVLVILLTCWKQTQKTINDHKPQWHVLNHVFWPSFLSMIVGHDLFKPVNTFFHHCSQQQLQQQLTLSLSKPLKTNTPTTPPASWTYTVWLYKGELNHMSRVWTSRWKTLTVCLVTAVELLPGRSWSVVTIL